MKQQRGIALIYVLMIFVLMVTVASQMTGNLWNATQKSTFYYERLQAKQLSFAAEQWLAQRLQDGVFDATSPDYKAALNQKLPVEEGNISIVMVDEQSRFNVNNLQAPLPKNAPQKNNPHQELFLRLLNQQGLDGQLANQLTAELKEQPLRHLSELLTVEEFDAQSVEQLSPSITVLPATTSINLNTAPEDVIMALHPDITEADAAALLAHREFTPLDRVSALAQIPALSGKASLLQKANVDVKSTFFSAYITAQFRDAAYFLKTTFYRNNDTVQVVSREIQPLNYLPPADDEDAP